MLKFFPRLQVFKNSTGTNVFDGTTAKSYDWYTYAYVFKEGEEQVVFTCENSYSSTTAKHMSELRNLLGYPKELRILAPQGLSNLGAALREINHAINMLNDELKNPRCKKPKRIERIVQLQEQVKYVEMLQSYLAQGKEKEVA